MKKCKKCGAPLEGFLYNTVGKLMGIKPSVSDPENLCNKCESEQPQEAETADVVGEQEVSAQEPEVSETDEVKDDTESAQDNEELEEKKDQTSI